jgi:rare lipoprotein A
VAAVLAGCSSTPRWGGDSGPGRSPQGMATEDAVPRIEPIRQGGPNKPYSVAGRSYVPMTGDQPYDQTGIASWYGSKFHDHPTSSGERYDMYAMTAAHKTMPIPSYARVRNLKNGREVIVRVNDRGPFVDDRIIDLSWAAAVKLGIQGLAPVEVQRITFDEIRAGVKPPAHPEAPLYAAATPSVPVAPPATVPGSATDPAALLPDVLQTDGSGAAAAVASEDAGFWVQLGAFSRSDGARALLDQVASEMDWLSPALTVVNDAGLHRLQAGPFRTREQASEAADRIRAAMQLSPVVVRR